jgi:ferredoxin
VVIFFSGTGNSRFGARIIAWENHDEIRSFQDLLHEGVKSLHSEKPWVFVTPTYAWRPPRCFLTWLRSITLTGSKNAYFVMTAGDSVGAAGTWLSRTCAQKGWTFMGLGTVRMPENYLALFRVPSKDEGKRFAETRKPRFEAFARTIMEGKRLLPEKAMLANRWQSYVTNPLFYAFVVKDKGFWVTSACIGCGMCTTACPLSNITMTGGRPKWNGNCTHCMACITSCPTKAIEYKHTTMGKPRYRLDE